MCFINKSNCNMLFLNQTCIRVSNPNRKQVEYLLYYNIYKPQEEQLVSFIEVVQTTCHKGKPFEKIYTNKNKEKNALYLNLMVSLLLYGLICRKYIHGEFVLLLMKISPTCCHNIIHYQHIYLCMYSTILFFIFLLLKYSFSFT